MKALLVLALLGACMTADAPLDDDAGGDDGKSDDAAARANCGRFDDPSWVAPARCRCHGPDGETTYTNTDGQLVPITCEDRELQACPSTSGVGCSLSGVGQSVVKAPETIRLHFDIGGHLHDLCCAQHYAQPDSANYHVRCNGCTGGAPDAADCVNEGLPVDGWVLGTNYNSQQACAVEWSYATTAPFYSNVRWFGSFDTSTRWTAVQVVARNLAGTPGPYVRPDGQGGPRPLYGKALAPNARDRVDHRAPNGTVLGSGDLSSVWTSSAAALGLDAAQISSFCKSGKATLAGFPSRWKCTP